MRSTEVRVLGGLVVSAGGEARPVGGPKAQQLLSVLVAHRSSPVAPDRLIETLWGDRPPKTATATVQTQISRLRALLAPGFSVNLTSGGYVLDTLQGDVDASQFESLLVRARTLRPHESASVLESALALWQGPAFGRYADLTEVHGEAMRLDELRLVATDAWAEAKMAGGEPAAMVGELEALVALHPLRETYWRLLMLALYQTGRQGEALRRGGEFRDILGNELGLDLPPSVRELEARILADDPGLRPTNRVSVGSETAVVIERLQGATSFIGRDPDVRLLSDEIRTQPLVTVTGPGGVGKTRLALRVAGQAMNDFDDGVTIVEFAPLRDPAGTARVIALALDIQQRQYRTIESTIEEHLASSNRLLLLDNCEHVTDTLAPLVDRLRSACPRLRILATSREPLGLAGEYVEVLHPLALPDPDAALSTEVRRSAAVELFVERAAAATRGFTLTDDNAGIVANICRRLDGLPLALELAAARLRSMGIEALGARLDQRIDLVGQTQRGADGRQRTLHHLVAWSHDLLAPDEQEIFEQLAVFAGGFELPAAEAICSVVDPRRPTVDTLALLIEKSMVVMVDARRPRYRLLEPLREFGLDRLHERGMVEAIEDRHLEWFLDLAERASAGLDGPDEPLWSDGLDRDYDNLRAAHLIAIRRGEVRSALRLVAALAEFAFRRIKYEVTSWAETSASLAGVHDHPDLPTVLAVSAYGHFVQGDMDAAIRLSHQALDAQTVGDRSDSGLPERVLGNALFYMEQPTEALFWMDRMLQSARRSGSPARIAHALYMGSVGATSIGDNIRGALLAGEAKAAADAADSPTAHAQADYALGLALEASDPDAALSHLERASAGAARAGNRWIEAFSLTEVHWLTARHGQHMAALVGYAEVVDIWYRGGDWANQWLSLRRVLGLLINLGAFDAAAVLHGALAAVGASHALPFEPADAERLAENIEQLRSLLGPARFADAVRRGASMRDGEIIGFVKQQIAELTAEPVGPGRRDTPQGPG